MDQGSSALISAPDDEARLCEIIRTQPAASHASVTAFAELYIRNYDLAMASAYRILGDRSRAEDAVSEAFAKTLRAMQSGQGPTESFRGYLLSAVRSEALRVPAVERMTEPVPLEEFDASPGLSVADPLHRFAERDQLVRAFASMPESWRRVLYLLEVEDLPADEVAARLELSSQALASLAFRAREGLRGAYLQQYVDAAPPECVETAPALAEYVRGSLRRRKRTAVHRHVEGCVACGEQVSRLSRINQNLKLWIGPLFGGAGLAGMLLGEGAPGAAAAPLAVTAHGSSRIAIWAWSGLGAAVAAGIVFALLFQPGAVPVVDPDPRPGPSAELESPHDDPGKGDNVGEDSRPANDLDDDGGNPSERPSGDDFTPDWVLIEPSE